MYVSMDGQIYLVYYHYGLKDMFYSITSSNFFDAEIVPKMESGSPFNLALEVLSTSLLSGTINVLASPCALPTSELESAISPGSSSFFYLRMVFRNQCLHARCIHCYWSDIVLASFEWIN